MCFFARWLWQSQQGKRWKPQYRYFYFLKIFYTRKLWKCVQIDVRGLKYPHELLWYRKGSMFRTRTSQHLTCRHFVPHVIHSLWRPRWCWTRLWRARLISTTLTNSNANPSHITCLHATKIFSGDNYFSVPLTMVILSDIFLKHISTSFQ